MQPFVQNPSSSRTALNRQQELSFPVLRRETVDKKDLDGSSERRLSPFILEDLSNQCDTPFFHYFFNKKLLDPKGYPTEKLDTRPLGTIFSRHIMEFRKRLKAFLSDEGQVHFRDGRKLDVQMEYLFQYIHAVSQGKLPFFQVVGGAVRFFFGERLFLEALESFGEIVPQEIVEQIKSECQDYPQDFDFRFPIRGMRSMPFYEKAALVQTMTSSAIYFLGQSIFFKDPGNSPSEAVSQPCMVPIPPSYFQDVRSNAFRKYSYISPEVARNSSHFGIASLDISDSTGRKSTLEAIFIGELAREHLFGLDDLKVSVPIASLMGDMNKKIVWITDQGSSWTPILHRALRIVGDLEPQTINHKGFLLLLSYMTKGYRSVDDGFVKILFETFRAESVSQSNPFQLINEINQVINEHHKEEVATVIPFVFNFFATCGELNALDDFRNKLSVFAEFTIQKGLTHPALHLLNQALKDPEVFTRISAYMTLFYHVQEAMNPLGSNKIKNMRSAFGAMMHIPFDQAEKRYFHVPYDHRAMVDLFDRGKPLGENKEHLDAWLFQIARKLGFFDVRLQRRSIASFAALAEELDQLDSSFFKAISLFIKLKALEMSGERLIDCLERAFELFYYPVNPVFRDWFDSIGLFILAKGLPEDCPLGALFKEKGGNELIEEAACYLCSQPNKKFLQLGLKTLKRFGIDSSRKVADALCRFSPDEAVYLFPKEEDFSLEEWRPAILKALKALQERGFRVADLPLFLRMLAPVKRMLSQGEADRGAELTQFVLGLIPLLTQSAMVDIALDLALSLGEGVLERGKGFHPCIMDLLHISLQMRDERAVLLWNRGGRRVFDEGESPKAQEFSERLVEYLLQQGREEDAESIALEVNAQSMVRSGRTLSLILKKVFDRELSANHLKGAESILAGLEKRTDKEHPPIKRRMSLLLMQFKEQLLTEEAFKKIKQLVRDASRGSNENKLRDLARILLNSLIGEASLSTSKPSQTFKRISNYFLDKDLIRFFSLAEPTFIEAVNKLLELSSLEKPLPSEILDIIEALFPLACRDDRTFDEEDRNFFLRALPLKIQGLSMREAISQSPFIIQLKKNIHRIILDLACNGNSLELAIILLGAMRTYKLSESYPTDFIEALFKPIDREAYGSFSLEAKSVLRKEVHLLAKRGDASSLRLAATMISCSINDGIMEGTIGIIDSFVEGMKENPHAKVQNGQHYIDWVYALARWNQPEVANRILAIAWLQCKGDERRVLLKGIVPYLKERTSEEPLFLCRLLLILSSSPLTKEERRPFLPIAKMAARDLLSNETFKREGVLAIDLIKAFRLFQRAYVEEIIKLAEGPDRGRLKESVLDLYSITRSRAKEGYPFTQGIFPSVLKLFLNAGPKIAAEGLIELIHDFDSLFSQGIPEGMDSLVSDILLVILRFAGAAKRPVKEDFLEKAHALYERYKNSPVLTGTRKSNAFDQLFKALISEGSLPFMERAATIFVDHFPLKKGNEQSRAALLSDLFTACSRANTISPFLVVSLLKVLEESLTSSLPRASLFPTLELLSEKSLDFAEGLCPLLPRMITNQRGVKERKSAFRLMGSVMKSLAKGGRWSSLSSLRSDLSIRKDFSKELIGLEAGNFSLYLRSSSEGSCASKDIFSFVLSEVSLFGSCPNPEELFREMIAVWINILKEEESDFLFVSSMYQFLESFAKSFYEDGSAYAPTKMVYVSTKTNAIAPFFYMMCPDGMPAGKRDRFEERYKILIEMISKRMIQIIREKHLRINREMCLEAFASAIFSLLNMFPGEKRAISELVLEYLKEVRHISSQEFTKYYNVAKIILEGVSALSIFSHSDNVLYRLILLVNPSSKFTHLTPKAHSESVFDLLEGLLTSRCNLSLDIATGIVYHHFPDLIHIFPGKVKALFCNYVDAVSESPFIIGDDVYILKRAIQSGIELFSPNFAASRNNEESCRAILDCQLHLAKALFDRALKRDSFFEGEREQLLSAITFFLDFIKNLFNSPDRKNRLIPLILPATQSMLALSLPGQTNRALLNAISILCRTLFSGTKHSKSAAMEKVWEKGINDIAAFVFALVKLYPEDSALALSFAKEFEDAHPLFKKMHEELKRSASSH